MRKASISIYLALTLTIMISLIVTLIEGARVNAMKLRIECVVDMGIYSVFAEFHRELLEQYDLFFIDTSYGGTNATIHNTTEHMKNYMEYNFKPAERLGALFQRDWFALSADSVIATEMAIASDERGGVLKRQAVAYKKNKTGLSIIPEVEKAIQITKKNSFDTREVYNERRSVENDIKNIELPLVETESGEWEKASVNNPADSVNAARGDGILSLVVDNREELSTRSVNLSEYCSNRTLHYGDGLSGREEQEDGIAEELIFGEYLMEKCGKYTDFKEKNYLKYQIEYLLEGKNSDTENLKGVVNKLLLFREAANFTYLLSDMQKIQQAEAMAAGLSIVAMVPQIQPLIKYSILFAWSFAESVNDVKILLEKGKVPLLKKSGDWKLSLENMLTFQKHLSTNANSTEGLSYEMYQRIFLSLLSQDEKMFRFMDIVEMDIRSTLGNDHFCIDACIDRMAAEIMVSSKFGYSYRINEEYEYEIK